MTDFDRIASSAPVNRQAALSSAQGRDVKSTKKVLTADSHTPIPTRAVRRGEEDLTGVRFGRFTVVGRYGGPVSAMNSRWVVRCDCSVFSLRRAKAVKNQKNQDDRCEECRHIVYLRRFSEYQTTGKNRRDGPNSSNGDAA